jgi:peptide/nickel transport system substrate-binding protein
LLDQGARSFDPDARRSIYRRVQELVRRDLPFLPLYQTNSVQGNKKGISGVVPNVNTRTESWNALAWSWAS